MQPPHENPLKDRFVRMSDIVKATGYARNTIEHFIRAGLFPPPIKIGRTSVWLASELNAWIDERAAARTSKGAA